MTRSCRSTRTIRLAIVEALSLIVAPLGAQTAVLSGTVLRDSAGHPFGGAEVSLPGLQRTTSTNYRGEFKISQLPAGLVTVTIRAVGFLPMTDTVTLVAGTGVDREFILQDAPQRLDPVVATAPERKYISPGLREFEERKNQGFGYFIDEAVLRKEQNRDMVNLLFSRIPGLMRVRVPPNKVYVGTARKCAAGPAILNCKGGTSFCPVTLYVNGAVIYSAARSNLPSDVPDLQQFRIDEYAGIEYYAGGATMPLKYNATDSGCGTLLLWTRER